MQQGYIMPVDKQFILVNDRDLELRDQEIMVDTEREFYNRAQVNVMSYCSRVNQLAIVMR